LTSQLGKLSLIISSLRYFSPRLGPRQGTLFWTALISELFFGLLTGFKSAIVLPLFIVAFCFYLKKGKIPTTLIAFALAAIFLAYNIVDPFRTARNFQGASLSSTSEIIRTLALGLASNVETSAEQASIFLRVLSRSNLSYIGSFGLEYADAHDTLPEGSPAFFANMLLVPLHALLPRFILDSKPLASTGLWYTQVVLGWNFLSSTAMGPFAYLYFVGKYFAVPLAFFIIGILQRSIWSLTTPWANEAGSVLYLSVMPSLAIVSSAVDSAAITLIRTFILVVFIVMFVYRKPKRPWVEPSSSLLQN
jgi:hypothetical protein